MHWAETNRIDVKSIVDVLPFFAAVIDLNGRYFGGRTVKAGFYNLDKFRRLDLTDDLVLK